MKKKMVVNDKMQSGYTYFLTQPQGKNFDPEFNPHLTPKQMLKLGVFGGKYMTDTKDEFPNDWFEQAKLSPEKKDPSLNYFKVEASMPLSEWRKRGWINEEHDPRGWFQWYCRYFMGRRLKEEDQRQIKRWKAFKRHWAQVEKNCQKKDYDCRRKQRQALLHWAYDARKI
jgi:ribosomal protein L35